MGDIIFSQPKFLCFTNVRKTTPIFAFDYRAMPSGSWVHVRVSRAQCYDTAHDRWRTGRAEVWPQEGEILLQEGRARWEVVKFNNSISVSFFYNGIIKFLWIKNFPQILQRDARQVFSVRALALNNFHQNQEQTFQLCSLGINYYVVSELYERWFSNNVIC